MNKMSNIILFISIFFLSKYILYANYLNDIQKLKLKGPVKVMQQLYYKSELDSIKKKWLLKYVRKFNEFGNIYEDILYKPDGMIEWKKTYKYGQSGDLFEEIKYSSTGEIIENS